MAAPLVSINMITYNHAPFISQAINGVLQQKTDFQFELIIGEDCSTDGTREIVFEYQKKHPENIIVITSDVNVGAKKNSLRTFEAGVGKYIAFCEGDDYWHNPDKLQKQVAYLESHPECGLVFSSFDVYHVKKRKTITDFIKYRKRIIPENLSITDIVGGKGEPLTCTVMVRRDLYKKIIESDPYLHKSGHFLMGDTQIWAEMSTMAHLHFIPESLATHNITEESATRSSNLNKELRFSLSSAELLLYLCNKYELPSHIKERYEEYRYHITLRLAFQLRNKQLADDVRRNKKKAFAWKEWLLYYGAKKWIVYYPLRIAVVFLSLFKMRHSQWN